MRNIQIFFSLLLLLAGSSAISAKERIIERPAFTAWSGTIIEIDKVVLSEQATVLHIQAFYRPNYWINIPKVTYLVTDSGNKYQIQSADGINIDEHFYMPASGTASFTLTFPPIPESVSEFDFIEEVEDGFKIWGIRLDGKLPQPELPGDIVINKTDKNTSLPALDFKKGKATLKGKLLGYKPGIMKDFDAILNNPHGSAEQRKVKLNDDGSFSAEFDVISPTPCSLYIGELVTLFLAPGEETVAYINLTEAFRRRSRLRKDTEPAGKLLYVNGYLAGITEEYNDFKDFNPNPDLFKDIVDMDLDGVKDYFLGSYNNNKNDVSSMNISDGCKQILYTQLDAVLAMNLLNLANYHMHSLMENNKLKREDAGEYYQKLKLPENQYEVFAKLTSLNSPQALLSSTYSRLVGFPIFLQEFSKALGTNEGIYFDLSELSGTIRKISDFQPLTEEDRTKLQTLPPVFIELAEDENNKILALIESNKKKSGFKVNETGEVANEDLFASMIAPFHGKVILVDFWATWCGPCRMANQRMAPMKEELKDKDIVYLYIAGDNSPEKTWENMIPDIPGEHFRLNPDQWEYLCNNFNVEGVPTYLIVNKEGDVSFRTVGFPGADKMKEELVKAF